MLEVERPRHLEHPRYRRIRAEGPAHRQRRPYEVAVNHVWRHVAHETPERAEVAWQRPRSPEGEVRLELVNDHACPFVLGEQGAAGRGCNVDLDPQSNELAGLLERPRRSDGGLREMQNPHPRVAPVGGREFGPPRASASPPTAWADAVRAMYRRTTPLTSACRPARPFPPAPLPGGRRAPLSGQV